ncbi:unnamed protein product [Vitrella brassicaformis CCMP3155]|uniref:Uncharacterized protein n=1 Tax=Vitrella brassicaformis (strain CCMP3155) TaxID=1169540 RepID=A0A0G4GG94_VITBC|nr:unnamed protein product [Vitrella brassicaformis CCMP3155]|mmetsp:Transcript_35156/g.87285  ORF Transcript_35156/g.87285 Transcript_35156/m.87285 type:complete len:340 (-) Transcript_35156:740-1759(-)|eukprot:CEM28643.1 unnamed protein product [Vitrella brassicaformis CCMP3155]
METLIVYSLWALSTLGFTLISLKRLVLTFLWIIQSFISVLVHEVADSAVACGMAITCAWAINVGWFSARLAHGTLWQSILTYWHQAFPNQPKSVVSWCVFVGDVMLHPLMLFLLLRYTDEISPIQGLICFFSIRLYLLLIEGGWFPDGHALNALYKFLPPQPEHVFYSMYIGEVAAELYILFGIIPSSALRFSFRALVVMAWLYGLIYTGRRSWIQPLKRFLLHTTQHRRKTADAFPSASGVASDGGAGAVCGGNGNGSGRSDLCGSPRVRRMRACHSVPDVHMSGVAVSARKLVEATWTLAGADLLMPVDDGRLRSTSPSGPLSPLLPTGTPGPGDRT